MKKCLTTVACIIGVIIGVLLCIAGVIAGGVLLWEVVFPFIGNVFNWMFGWIPALF